MKIDRTKIGAKVLSVALLFNVLVLSCMGFGQDKISAPRKVDEFGDVKADDAQAYLDLFAQQILSDQTVRGVIVGYRLEEWPYGSYLRYFYGYRDYLVNKRGIAPKQIEVIDGGRRDKISTELWLVPSGASFSIGSQDASQRLDNLTKFDQLSFGPGPGCESEYTLGLEEPRHAVRFFAEELRKNPISKGIVLLNPRNKGSLRETAKLTAEIKASLTQEYGIAPGRIATSVESRQPCSALSLWLAPPNFEIPKGRSVGQSLYAQLMAEAEQSGYSVRRIELLGNTYTRDNVIRRRLLQNEGDIFRRALLEQSLRSVSKLRNFGPVGIQDVEVQLNRKDKLIDFLINLRERPSSQKRRTQ